MPPFARPTGFLVTATARAENTGQTCRTFRKGLESLGSGPILIEPLKATPILQHDGPAKPVVHALDWYGLRTNTTLPVEANPARGWKLTLGDVPAAWFEGSFDAAK